MRLALILLAGTALWAQTKAPDATPKAADPAPEVKDLEATSVVSGSVELGFRVLGTGGNSDVYRTVVNLGEGPRLLDADLRLVDPTGKLFQDGSLKASGFGGDPTAVSRFELYKPKIYRFVLDHRRFQYFNALPSYANPRAASPNSFPANDVFSQRAFDTNREYSDFDLTLLPGRTISPYFDYQRNRGSGRGISDLVVDANEYPIATRLLDRTQQFRAGAQMRVGRWQFLAEQGGTTYNEDQGNFLGGRNRGNRTNNYLGQSLFLSQADQTWRGEGHSIFSRGTASAQVTDWLDFEGFFLYSRPQMETTYAANATGRLVDISNVAFLNALQFRGFSNAVMPHTTGSAAITLRPVRFLRIVESFSIDRSDLSSRAALVQQAANALTGLQVLPGLALNHQRQQVDMIVDVSPKFSIRAGHRYVWGESQQPASLFQSAGLGTGKLNQQVATIGVSVRPNSKVSVNFTSEFAGGSSVFFRTSLQNYKRYWTTARLQPKTWMSLQVRGRFLTSDTPDANGGLRVRNHDYGASIQLIPVSNRFTLLLDYTRTQFSSNLAYLQPQFFTSAVSRYRDYAHVATALLDTKPLKKIPVALSVGGSLVSTTGSRPTDYYQPLARVTIAAHKRFELIGEYRWYGLDQTLYTFEGFRSQQFTGGLRIHP